MENTRKRNSVILFVQENVAVRIPGPMKEEAATKGTILVIKEDHGYVVEWRPSQHVTNSRASPEAEHLDWEEVSSAVVEYNPKSEKDPVEIKTPAILAKPISFDVCDIKSFKRIEKANDGKIDVIFTVFLRDGTNIPSFYFENMASFLQFILVLERFSTIKRSEKDNTLFLVNDRNVHALEKSFSELDLFDESNTHIVTKLLHNPMETAMGGFSKVTNLVYDYLLHTGGTEVPSPYSDEKVIEMLHESLPDVDINHHEEPGYELITCIQMPPRPRIKRENPVTSEEWASHFDSEGRVKDLNTLMKRIFKGGLLHSVRSEAWKFLVGYYSFDLSNKEREVHKKSKIDDYYRMKLQWKTLNEDQESRFSAFRERRSLIEKDVSRTDRTHPFFEGDTNMNVQMLYDILMTYCMYNFDLGYVQGMSDLLSPILVVMQNEPDAFWCFASWMDKVGINFEMDQQGMKIQLQNLNRLMHFVDSQLCNYLESHDSGNLYFAFRWLLILFKRDFKFQEVMRLWEVLWTNLPCKNFHLLICLAILDTEKLTIMENTFGLSEILKHINDLAYKINLDETLAKAEAIYQQVIESNYLPDVVQSILGIDAPVVTQRLQGPGVGERVASEENTKSASSTPDQPIENNPSPSSVTSSIEDLEGYVDLEHQYNISFGLFT